MTDNSAYRRSRSASPRGRDEPAADPARHGVSDPLAELARLLGHHEAFCDSTRQEARLELPQGHVEEPPPSTAWPQSDWRREDTRSAHDRHAAAADPLAGHTRPDETPRQPDSQYGAGEYYVDEAHYDDELPKRRRGLGVVAAVIGLALLGAAGAGGYWAWSGGGNSGPPLVTADTTSTRIVPGGQGGDDPSNRRIDSRKDLNAAAPVVERNEMPAQRTPATPPQILPSLPSAGGVYGAAPNQSAAPAPQPGNVVDSAETHTLHTERIVTTQLPNVDPGQTTGSLPGPAASNAAPPASEKQGVGRSKQGTTDLAPLVVGSSSPTVEPRVAPAGSYVVQLSSQRSEKAAQATSRALQIKYPTIFDDRRPFIRRSDLGDKGVFYRAQVGPFPALTEANQFCGRLKKAGGQCIVQKN
jgi:hypothetical protein